MKRLMVVLVCLVTIGLLGVTGSALAQPPSPFHILHKAGAIYHYGTGWTVSTPPYYPGTDWAVDFTYGPLGASILHKDGCIWGQGTGWLMDGYYPGSNYARALGAVPDLSGCWCAYTGEWRIWEGVEITPDDEYVIHGDQKNIGYPYEYVQVTQNGGTGLLVTDCKWNGVTYVCKDVYGSVVGGQIVLRSAAPSAANDCSRGHGVVGYLVWNFDADCWGADLAFVGSDRYCQGDAEPEGWFGSITLMKKYFDGETWLPCVCPPTIE